MANRNPKPKKQPKQKPLPVAKPVAIPEPTPEQVARLIAADVRVNSLSAEFGPPKPSKASAEPVGPTLEESLKRVESLLELAGGHFEMAKEYEAAKETDATRLATAVSEQEAELAEARCRAEAELAELKSSTEGELDARKKALAQAEADLSRRAAHCKMRESEAAAKEADVRAREAGLLELAASLNEREINAEREFLAEKIRVLKPLEEEVASLRQERDQINAEIATRRDKAEEAARAKATERAERWAAQDHARTEREAEARRALDAAMVKERQEQLAKLREELATQRAKAEALWQEELDERRAVLDARAAALDGDEQADAEKARALRRQQQDVAAAQEIIEEDRSALGRKLERLVAERTEEMRHELAALRTQLEDSRALTTKYFTELESRRELDRRFGGRAPEQIVSDLSALERERDGLAQQLRERPDAGAAERLTELERERSAWLEERAVLQGALAKASGELATRRLAAIELEALKKQKEALEVHKQLLDGAVDELRVRVDELTRQEDHRNPMTALTSLDAMDTLQAEARTTTPLGRATPTLREFAVDLRHRIATGVEGRTLYYTERDVRAFLGGLAMTRMMLLQGISGTGKTSLPLAFAKAVGGGIEVVEVQAGWRDRQDLVGYYNAFHRHFYATNFLQALYKAGTPAFKDRVFMMVMDEINLSRPEQFFADFLSALEQPMDKRRLTLVNDPVANAPKLMVDDRHLPIPPNVWFVGTANHDETTAEFADKTYDRAHVMEMPRKTQEAQFDVGQKGDRNPISYQKLIDAFAVAADRHSDQVKRATAWLREAPFAKSLGERFRVGWGNRLENQLASYLPVVVEAGGSVGEAMDHLLVTKVMRKLKDRHDVRASALEDLSAQLLDSWDKLDGQNPPERCNALIETEVAAKKGEEPV